MVRWLSIGRLVLLGQDALELRLALREHFLGDLSLFGSDFDIDIAFHHSEHTLG